MQGACGRAQLGADGLLVVAERAGEELVQLGRNLLGRRLAGLALTLRPGQRVSAAAQRRAEAGANARMHARTISANGACGARRARRRRRGRTGARARRSAEGAGGVRRSAKGAAKAKARGCATRRSGQAGMRSPQHSRSASLSEVSPARGRANRPAGARAPPAIAQPANAPRTLHGPAVHAGPRRLRLSASAAPRARSAARQARALQCRAQALALALAPGR